MEARGWPRTLVLEGIEAIVFRTIGDRPSLWETQLPPELLRLPEELARVDALLDDPAFFAPFAPHFHPVLGRPSTPAEWFQHRRPPGGVEHDRHAIGRRNTDAAREDRDPLPYYRVVVRV